MSRLFAVEPPEGELFVEVYERHQATTELYRFPLVDEQQIEPTLEAIGSTPHGELDSALRHDVPPTFLICTQGSHDVCCGSSGVALADQVEADREYVVRRVSHTGGHRFAPTLLAFPEGRMWAFVDLPMVDRIATNTATSTDHVNHARGWWGAKKGPAQVAECVVRSQASEQSFIAPTITVLEGGGEQLATKFAIDVAEDQWIVRVDVGRIVPSISCEALGGQPAKPGREFTWSIEAGPATIESD